MQGIYITLFLLLALIDAGYSLECYRCVEPALSHGPYSFAQCRQDQVKQTCLGNETKCLTRRYKTYNSLNNEFEERYRKKCLSPEECDQEAILCEEINALGGECDISCCNTTLCNSATDVSFTLHFKVVSIMFTMIHL